MKKASYLSRIIVATAVLISAASVNATRITVHAPIDGHIQGEVPLENSIHDKAISEAKEAYDVLRVLKGGVALYNPENPKIAEFETLEKDMFDDGEPALVLNNFLSENESLLTIRSDVLELQLLEEIQNYKNARSRLEIAENLFKREQDIKAKIDEEDTRTNKAYRENQAIAESARITEFQKRGSYGRGRTGRPFTCNDSNNDHKKRADCLGERFAAKAANAMRAESEVKREIDKIRYDARFAELERMKAISESSIDSARGRLLSVIATLRLGKVVCPQRCKIQKVFVVPGQYVNKGDPLFEFTWLAD